MINDELQWIRDYKITFAGPSEKLTISSKNVEFPLKINFKISEDPKTAGQAACNLSIFGLTETSISRIVNKGTKCWLEVGYKDKELATLFIGEVRKTQVKSSSNTHELKLQLLASKIDTKIISKTYNDAESNYGRFEKLLTDVAATMPNLITQYAFDELILIHLEEPSKAELVKAGLPNRSLLDNDAVGALVVNTSGIDALTSFGKDFDIRPIVVNDQLHIVREGGDFNVVTKISAELGKNLLSVPRTVLQNEEVPDTTSSRTLYEFKMRLDPRVTMNSIIATDHIRNDFGNVEKRETILRVTKVSHSGGNRTADWITTVTGHLPEKLIIKSPRPSVAYDIDNPIEDVNIDGTVGLSLFGYPSDNTGVPFYLDRNTNSL